ncbi:DUF5336 domain-containing protein [Tomitella cavernea]|uniref:DUF5336 domain-containing protein n=1 Tax=Tomitella cavernea TaxID=1387982 RepID=UPI0027DE459D|nr:DUF5336 domain-containing protein [Tomitella cavernea]
MLARAAAAAPAVVALSGVAGFFFGFGPYIGADDGTAPNFFGSMFGNPLVVALVLIAGLIAALGLLPKRTPNLGASAVASATAVLVLLCSLGFSDINNFFGGISRSLDPGVGAGWAFWVVLGIAVVQTGFAAVAVLVDAGVLRAGSAPSPGARGPQDYRYPAPPPYYGYGGPPQQPYTAPPGQDPRYMQQPPVPPRPQYGPGGYPPQAFAQGYWPQPGHAGPPPAGTAGPRYGYGPASPQWGAEQAYGGSRPDYAGQPQPGGGPSQEPPQPEGTEDPTHMFRAGPAGDTPQGGVPDTGRSGEGASGTGGRDDPAD